MSKRNLISQTLIKMTDMELENTFEKKKVQILDREIQIIDYERSTKKDSLDPEKLNEDIKKLDKKNIENILMKCQRLYLFSKHKLYNELTNKKNDKERYKTLEEFALIEHNISRMQLFKYITIFSKLEKVLLDMFNNVKSSLQMEALSVEKLYLLSRIEEKRKINFWFNKLFDEHLSVRDLKSNLEKEKLLPKKAITKNRGYVLKNISNLVEKLPKKITPDEVKAIKEIISKLKSAIE